MPARECPYLPDRMERIRAFWVGQGQRFTPGDYHRCMNAGFRRSGRVVYQPVCAGCRACLPIRVLVPEFRPGKSQRRCQRRNADLRMSADVPRFTQEKYELYLRYATGWHGRAAADEDPGALEAFLYDSPVDTVECCYRQPDGRLVAVGICDLCPRSLSTVYCFWDPDQRHRGLGTFTALCEIALAARLEIPYYYLGYWIEGCGAMSYKASFRPNEILWPDGVWRPDSGRPRTR